MFALSDFLCLVAVCLTVAIAEVSSISDGLKCSKLLFRMPVLVMVHLFMCACNAKRVFLLVEELYH